MPTGPYKGFNKSTSKPIRYVGSESGVDKNDFCYGAESKLKNILTDTGTITNQKCIHIKSNKDYSISPELRNYRNYPVGLVHASTASIPPSTNELSTPPPLTHFAPVLSSSVSRQQKDLILNLNSYHREGGGKATMMQADQLFQWPPYCSRSADSEETSAVRLPRVSDTE
ncbi:hypothetical protein J6590_025161 [Homalodisca vitripennis]|nr:hypothetical protein J6590_025161 [Homalodisca vitripennis]